MRAEPSDPLSRHQSSDHTAHQPRSSGVRRWALGARRGTRAASGKAGTASRWQLAFPRGKPSAWACRPTVCPQGSCPAADTRIGSGERAGVSNRCSAPASAPRGGAGVTAPPLVPSAPLCRRGSRGTLDSSLFPFSPGLHQALSQKRKTWKLSWKETALCLRARCRNGIRVAARGPYVVITPTGSSARTDPPLGEKAQEPRLTAGPEPPLPL